MLFSHEPGDNVVKYSLFCIYMKSHRGIVFAVEQADGSYAEALFHNNCTSNDDGDNITNDSHLAQAERTQPTNEFHCVTHLQFLITNLTE